MNSDVKIGDNRLEMIRVFDAPRERVFDAWKRPEKVQQWWGCQGTSKVESIIDFRPGGSFTHKMVVEGAGEMVYSGVYDEIVEPEKIAWHSDFVGSMARVTVEFIAQGSQTKLILTQVGFPAPDLCKIVSEGLTAAMDKLERLLIGQAALAGTT
jgi:uncharacterized protein YndB with AHSA1/START domain